MYTRNAEGIYHSPLLETLPWVMHGFGTQASDRWPGEYTSVKQIHSDVALVADGQRACVGQGDALIVSEPGNVVGIRTADCIPILLADRAHRVVAAVHAGWRGTVANVAGKTVQKMAERFGTKPGDLIAALGPGIGYCCFEVGPEVSKQFAKLFPERTDLGGLDRAHVDLEEANYRQLLAAGVNPGMVDMTHLCTVCTPDDEFHSYRRDKDKSGRMVSAIGIVGK